MAVKAYASVSLARTDDGAIGESLSSGELLFNDLSFGKGLNNLSVYNNSSNGNVTITRQEASADNPCGDYELLIKNTGSSSPNCGGFSWAHASRANAIFIYRIIAKIPTGRNLVFATNAIGNSAVQQWLTSNAGTGKFQEYLFKLTCGASGTFSSTGFFSITGAVGSASAPVQSYIALAGVWDMTGIPITQDDLNNLSSQITTTTKNINDTISTLNGDIQKISETVETNSGDLKAVKENVLKLQKSTDGLSAELIEQLVTTDKLTGLVKETELREWIRWGKDIDNHSVLTLGSSLYDTQTRIQEDGLYIDVKGAVSTYFAKNGLSTNVAIANEYRIGDFTIKIDESGNLIIV